MVGINFKKWSHSANGVFVKDRFYYKGKWTPFIKLRFRYFKTSNQA